MGRLSAIVFLLLSAGLPAAGNEFEFPRGYEFQRLISVAHDNPELDNLIAERISEIGLSSKTLRDHRYTAAQYRELKARAVFPVMYFDVQSEQDLWGRIKFTIFYSLGDEFFEGAESHKIEGCRARMNRSGALEIRLDSCLDRSL